MRISGTQPSSVKVSKRSSSVKRSRIGIKSYRWRVVIVLVMSIYILSYRRKVLTHFSCDIDLWPFDPKLNRYCPLIILLLLLQYKSCMSKTVHVIVSKMKLFKKLSCDLDLWPQTSLYIRLPFTLYSYQICMHYFVSPDPITVAIGFKHSWSGSILRNGHLVHRVILCQNKMMFLLVL